MLNPVSEIITIGDEILIGQTIDTNSAWIGNRMSMLGIPVKRIVSVSDSPGEIAAALKDSLSRAEVVLITGGLGPTNDDRTKVTLTKFFGGQLVEDAEVLEDINKLFTLRSMPVTGVNRAQAQVPDNCRVVRNLNGTAPGMWWERDGKVIVSMPGVPYEMKSMMENSILPDLKSFFRTPVIMHKTVMTTGIPESRLAALLSDWEKELPKQFSLAYLPSPGVVKVRITGTGEHKETLETEILDLTKSLTGLVGDSFYGYDEITLEETVGKLLIERKLSVSTAESCTGGNISRLITRIPGSSSYFKGSVIAYANELKTNLLDVTGEMLTAHGAVSRPVVEQMAKGCVKLMNSDYAIATSGIAGPDGGTPDKPVGTVWIALADKQNVVSQVFQLGEHRERNITKASYAALNLLRLWILNGAIPK